MVIIRMKGFSEKRKELSQTIAFMIGSIRTEKGRRRYDFSSGRNEGNVDELRGIYETEDTKGAHSKPPKRGINFFGGLLDFYTKDYAGKVFNCRMA